MRAAVFGAGGQLGTDLVARLGGAAGFARADADVRDLDAVRRALAQARPEVVFNCAAFNGVDQAESEPALALAVNAEGARKVALACAEAGVRLLHFSTNFVFDGDRAEGAYSERDEPRPLGAYARSKLEGERATLEILPAALVVRTAGLFGAAGSAVKGGSFPARVIASARAGRELRVVADQRLNPTYTGDLAGACLELAASGLSGVVHLVAAGCCSFHELAVEALRLAGLGEVPVQAISSAELAAPAPRPRNGCLRSERVGPLRPWREGLAELVAAIAAGQD